MYKVVLADDETWEIIGLKKLIGKCGLPVEVVGEAENGIAALAEVEAKKPHILITDIRMPGLSGLDVLGEIKEREINTDVVILSGYAEFSYAQSAIRNGAKDYLLKPVDLQVLKGSLEKIIKAREALGKKADSPAANESTENATVMEQILMEIQESYREDITLQSLARKYHISESRLSVRLKELQGMSFSKYLTSRRIQKAKELLADERLSVEQVAGLVGYKDYYYFTKVFKRTVGLSPSKYRKGL